MHVRIQIEVQIYRDINPLWSITAPFPFPFSTMRAWPKCQFFVHEFSILNQYYVFRLKGLFSTLNAKEYNMNWANIFWIKFFTLMSICASSSKFNLLSFFILSTQDTSMAKIEFAAGSFCIEVMIYHDHKGRKMGNWEHFALTFT